MSPFVPDNLGTGAVRASQLGRAEVAAFVRRSATLPDDDAVVGLVHEATDGNPLFIGELVRLIETRAGETRAGRLPVPDGVRAVMRERIRLLPASCAELLAHAAVLGREFQSPLLAEVAGVSVDALPTALAAAVETGLVEARAPGHYAFSHVLVAETLVRDLEPGRRTALHLTVARALERRHEGDPAAPLATIAHHFLEAGALCAGEAVAAARRAAARALEGLAFEDAAELLERALASEALVLPPDGGRRAELLLLLGEASLRGGAGQRGRQACLEAAELGRALGRPALLARAALGYGLEFAFAVVDPKLVALLEEALRVLPATDSGFRGLRARLMARLAAALQPAIDPTAPIALARQAIALVQGDGGWSEGPSALAPDDTGAVRLDVLHIAASALVDYLPPDELIPLHQEVVALAGARRDRPRRLRALLRLVFAQLERGDRAASQRAIGDYEAAAAEFTQPRYRWPSILLRSMRAALDGRFEACARHVAEVQALDADADANLRRSLNAHRVLMAVQQDEDDQARAVIEEHLTMLAPGADDRVARLWRAVMPPNVRAGLFEPGLLAAFSEPQLVALCQDFNVACLLAEACTMVGDRAHAAPIAAALASRAGRVCVTTMGFGVQDLADRSLLLLAAVREEWDEMECHAGAALALAERLGAPPFLARVRFDLATALLRRGRQADRGRARELAALARAEAERMRMLVLTREARALEDRLGPSEVRSAVDPLRATSGSSASRPPSAPPAAGREEVLARREGDRASSRASATAAGCGCWPSCSSGPDARFTSWSCPARIRGRWTAVTRGRRWMGRRGPRTRLGSPRSTASSRRRRPGMIRGDASGRGTSATPWRRSWRGPSGSAVARAATVAPRSAPGSTSNAVWRTLSGVSRRGRRRWDAICRRR